MITHDHEYLTVREAAELLRVSVPTIRRWIASGRLHAVRPGSRSVRLRRSDVEPLPTRPVDGVSEWRRYAVQLGDGEVPEAEIAERLSDLRRRVLRRRGGRIFGPSLSLIHEARAERDERW